MGFLKKVLILYLFSIISLNNKDKKKTNEPSFSEWGFGKKQEFLTVASVGKDLYTKLAFLIKRLRFI